MIVMIVNLKLGHATGRYEIEPFKGIIKSRELVSKKQLDDLLTESGSNDGKV